MKAISDDITLQINLSPGDVNYAPETVSELIKKHQDIKQRLLIVDCCRPQKTKLVDPDKRFPLAIFNYKVEIITEIAQKFLEDGLVTQVYFLKPGDPLFKKLSKKYVNGVYETTHGAGGTANMGYWAGIEIPTTRYVVHYDADMLLYQKEGYSWVNDGLKNLADSDNFVTAIPRLCPPVDDPLFDLPSVHEGRTNISRANYWYNDFFSTQVFLLDKDKLNRFLPLVRGKLYFELLLRKYLRRAFPLDPEIILFRSLGSRGNFRVVAKSENAWVTHPVDKSETFINALPQIFDTINQGKYPAEQSGHENMNLPAWIKLFDEQKG